MIQLLSRLILFLLVIGLIVPALALGAISDNEKKITANDIDSNELFGAYVSVFGNYFMATAFGKEKFVYVYEKNADGWTQVAKLSSPGDGTRDHFGNSLSLSENFAVIGAPRDSVNGSNSGSAYIYQRDGTIWGNPVKLQPKDGAELNYFGKDVSISGDTIIIGATGNESRGAAYVFERKDGNWEQVSKLISEDINTSDLFGSSVSVSGDHAVVGALGDSDEFTNAGSAYTFQRINNEWVQTQKLTAVDAAISNFFGDSAFISGNVLVVGAYSAPYNGAGELGSAGQAYLYELTENGWNLSQRLIVNDQTGRQLLSLESGVSISGGYVVLGARGDSTNGRFSGAAYIFKKGLNGWSEIEKIISSDNATTDFFGAAVSISGSDIIISAFGDDVDNYTSSGSVYAYQIEKACRGNMNQDNVVDGIDIALFAAEFGQSCNCPGDFDGNGVVDDVDLAVIAKSFSQTDCSD